ncbi:GNAT family N-acetyltransferase [Paenibacillus sp. PL2-23]|uniref:GNAT family N-acetyltransferase n=1 Tax=Paenibacillus sp. PL2-23 TaxID=2100729 RepID=UPI0030F57730
MMPFRLPTEYLHPKGAPSYTIVAYTGQSHAERSAASGAQKRVNAMIRARKHSDDNELVRLIRTELIPLSHTARQLDAHMIRELPKRFRSGITYVAIRTKQGPPVAFVHFYVLAEQLYIDMLVTHPQHRGQSLGKTLMAYAEAYGRANHCQFARLFVDRINVWGRRFYNKLGYSTIRFVPELQCYELVKPLAWPPLTVSSQ